ncbi:MAG TPA: hypothetical protein VG146_07955 [Verrucomicrobiae bacterium]|nr:hypothetical protein [Verrucomicrobiae bacterium]
MKPSLNTPQKQTDGGAKVKTLNESFMDATASEARRGLVALHPTIIQPNMVIYRFADSNKPELYFTGKWWVGYSPFEALKQHAQRRNQTLSAAARHCLAIDFEWSKLDVLHKVILKKPVSAWAGTPLTQRVRKGNFSRPDRRWEPDREVTQLFIPGLDQADPNNPHQKIWQAVFQSQIRLG